MEEAVNLGVPKQGPVLAIDGPAGTGKSSVTKRLADLLGFIHIDTGALYRAIAYLTLDRLAKFPEEVEGDVAAGLARSAHLEFRRAPHLNPSNRVFANSQDVTEFIRTTQVSMAASRVSAVPEVRSALLGLQRRLGCRGKTILEGRDIGTVVFPDADLKFFLEATAEERAKRRLIEMEIAGVDVPTFEQVKTDIIHRDKNDSSRAVAPLRKAKDAVEIDTSSMTLDQVVHAMENIVRSRIKI